MDFEALDIDFPGKEYHEVVNLLPRGGGSELQAKGITFGRFHEINVKSFFRFFEASEQVSQDTQFFAEFISRVLVKGLFVRDIPQEDRAVREQGFMVGRFLFHPDRERELKKEFSLCQISACFHSHH